MIVTDIPDGVGRERLLDSYIFQYSSKDLLSNRAISTSYIGSNTTFGQNNNIVKRVILQLNRRRRMRARNRRFTCEKYCAIRLYQVSMRV